jgi:hypothetical protein
LAVMRPDPSAPRPLLDCAADCETITCTEPVPPVHVIVTWVSMRNRCRRRRLWERY